MDYIPPDTFDAPSSNLFPRQISGLGSADLESLNGNTAATGPFVIVDGMSMGNSRMCDGHRALKAERNRC